MRERERFIGGPLQNLPLQSIEWVAFETAFLVFSPSNKRGNGIGWVKTVFCLLVFSKEEILFLSALGAICIKVFLGVFIFLEEDQSSILKDRT